MRSDIKNLIICPSNDSKTMTLIVEMPDGTREKQSLVVEYETPVHKIPILVRSESRAFPQELLDTLMQVYLREIGLSKKTVFWTEYYKTRREYKELYAKELHEADMAFRMSAPNMNFFKN